MGEGFTLWDLFQNWASVDSVTRGGRVALLCQEARSLELRRQVRLVMTACLLGNEWSDVLFNSIETMFKRKGSIASY